MSDTIFAQATARGRAGVSIIRISGPDATSALDAFGVAKPRLREAALRRLVHGQSGTLVDQALVLWFPRPGSFTGEDTVELHVHGSLAVVRAVLDTLVRLPGFRPADPGEFTRRAMENGRLDLAQVEGLADLIAAETESQRRQALRLMDGVVSRRAAEWRGALVAALADIEVGIDFADEHLPQDLVAGAAKRLEGVRAGMMRELCGAGAAERLREGFEVALVGPPNVGKSTLLNALTGREVAITSDIAGTTRDVIEVRLDLRGLPVTLLDTAGLRDATDSIEEIGVERARIRAAASDLRVLLLEEPGTVPPGIDIRSDDIIVFGKADQGGRTEGFAVSGLTGQGIPELLDWIADVLERRVAGASTISHARQREAIARAITALEAACSALERPVPVLEIAADEVHRGLRALDFLVGKVDVETVLDTIFRSFCLGK